MEAAEAIKKESFRDVVSTIDKEGKRVWIYPKKPKGKYTNARDYVSWAFFILFFSIPFIKIGGEPLIMMNIPERKFILFGVIFWPQDFHLLLLGMIVFVIFIVLFTAVYGRIFCGWICPQTIFMEMLFRKIEYFIEGDYKYQQALDNQSLNLEKVFKKFLKHTAFFTLSFIIANVFLMYIIGSDEWLHMVKEPLSGHLSGFISMTVFTGIFYFIYAKFREQICTTICPYGRLQGVLLDKNSIVVAYDYLRGETRGKIRKNEKRDIAGKGDCIDCRQCVNVCPTGIDIRNGTQLECINCTACIDACNFMMDKVGLAQGLIRYDSEEGIAKGAKFRITKRIFAYSVVLVILIASLATLLITRSDVEATVLRMPGMMFQELEDNKVSNLYNVKFVNKTNKEIPVRLETDNKNVIIKMIGKDLMLHKQAIADASFFIIIPKQDIKTLKTKVKINVYSEERLLETVKTTFIGPVQ
jgi:cytochrome c oxidase accessory protein FixG